MPAARPRPSSAKPADSGADARSPAVTRSRTVRPAASKDPPMLTVHGRATSLNVQAVMWLLAELDLPVERLDVGFPFGGTDTPEYRAMNPNGLVPVLVDEHVTLFESAAILRYLAARHGRFPFWPEDPVARAPVDMWAEWGKTTLQPSFLRPVFWSRCCSARRPRRPRLRQGPRRLRAQPRHPRGPARRRPLLLGARLHPRRHRGRPAALPLLHRRHPPPRPPGARRLLRPPHRAPGLRRRTSWSPTTSCGG